MVNVISVSSINTDTHDNQMEKEEKKKKEAKDIKFLLEPPPNSHVTHCLGLTKPTLICSSPIAFLQVGHMKS